MKAYLVYELYNREYDNCLLLQSALRHKGIETEIVYKMDLLKIPVSLEPRFFIIPNCYNDGDLEYYYYASGCGNPIIINLQYEQVISDDETERVSHRPQGKARYLYNICWGESYKDFLISEGVDESRCIVSGALQLDFLKPIFKSYWISRKELLNRYDIDENAEVTLFISSFSFADNEYVSTASDKLFGKDSFLDFSILSQNSREGIIDWFEEYLKHHDKVIIYRKHPMEKYNNRLLELSARFPKTFFLIDDYNIKQWIVVSDRILNWYSTSAIECVIANKPFEILRPVPIEEKREIPLFVGAQFIETYDEFSQMMNSDYREIRYPFKTDLIQNSYRIDSITAFDRISDWICKKAEELENEPYVDSDYLKNRKEVLTRKHLNSKQVLKRIYQKLYRDFHFQIKSEKLRSRYAVYDWEFQADLKPETEKEAIIDRIVKQYYNGKTNMLESRD